MTWNTADPYATSPNLLKTPRPYVPTTPLIKRPSTASSQNTPILGQDIEAEIASHVHKPPATPNQPLSPVDAAGQQSSLSNTRSTKRCRTEAEKNFSSPTFGLALDTGSNFGSTGSMQTPPPTSTSATRRKAQQAQVAKLVQQSAAAGRRISVPMFPQIGEVESSMARTEEASPQRFPGLEFSPDIFEFSMSGPATAPIFPQHKLFWEPKDDDVMNTDFSADLTNPFDTPRQPPLDPFISTHSHSSASQAQTSMSFLDFQATSSKTSSQATAISCFAQASFVSTAGPVGDHNMHLGTSMNGVDPSLLFSSPSTGLESLDTCMVSTRGLNEDSLQPYAYQIQEAKREKAYCGIMKSKKKRKPDCDSPAVKAALETLRGDDIERPKFRRSATDTITIRTSSSTRQASEQFFKGQLENSTSNRRLSPRKLVRSENSRGNGLRPRSRTALALTIDSTGRARTETRHFTDKAVSVAVQDSLMGLDNQSDDSDSDSSSDQSTIGMITSQAPSFEFSSDNFSGTKVGRLAQDSLSHSSKSSYTSIHTSGSLAENWQSATNTKSSAYISFSESNQLGTQLVQNQIALSMDHEPVNNSIVEEQFSEAETVMESDEGDGSAQFELRKVLKDRQGARNSISGRGRPRHCSASQSISRPSKGHHSIHDKRTISNLSRTSPTTVSDPDLPSPRAGSSMFENVRCICHNTVNDGQMIAWYVLGSAKLG